MLLVAAVEVHALARGALRDSLSGRESTTQPSLSEADTLVLSYRHPSVVQ